MPDYNDSAEFTCRSLGYIVALAWPDFIETRGLILRSQVYRNSGDEVIDNWLSRNPKTVVESTMNQLHLYDLLGDDYDESQLGDLESIANRVADAWRCALTRVFPERQFEVSVTSEPLQYGPTITFHEVSG